MKHLALPRVRRVQTSILTPAIRAFMLVALLALSGCGTNFSQLLLQSGTALGRSAFDLFLTDVANQVANALEQTEETDTPDVGDTGGAAGGDAGGDTDDGSEGSGDDTIGPDAGDTALGEAVYADSGCAACHCADASGDCALSAPGLVGADAATLDDFLRGDVSHPVKPPLSDQDIADLEAYLGTL